jgi:hypothetical protein
MAHFHDCHSPTLCIARFLVTVCCHDCHLPTICIVQFFVNGMFPWPSLPRYFYSLILCKVCFHDCHLPTICTVPFFVRYISCQSSNREKLWETWSNTNNIYVNSSYNRVFLKVILSSPCLWACFHLLRSIPLFEWGPQSNEVLLNLGMKCWKSAFNAQGSR